MHYNTNELAEAIFTVNKHAKTALKPGFLYKLKRHAIAKMLADGTAIKKGLNFSDNPRNAQQSSTLLVECGSYLFHTTASKDDFATLPHLGHNEEGYRNPPSKINLNYAKKILLHYTGIEERVNPPRNEVVIRPTFTRLGDTTPTIPAQKYRKER